MKTAPGVLRRMVGAAAGAALGLLAGLVFVLVWTQLGLPAWSDDPKALDMLLICCVTGIIGGTIIGAVRLSRAPRWVLAGSAAVATVFIGSLALFGFG